MDDAFGTVVECPWVSLRSGLVRGSEELLNRVRALLDEKGDEKEVRWTAREEDAEGRIALAVDLTERQAERVWQVRVRVRLGAERRIDVTRAYGYKDGSAITRFEPMATEIRDVRRVAREGGNARKYNGATREMMQYAREQGFIPKNPQTKVPRNR